MRIEHIYRYPVKGLTAEALAETHLDPGETVPGDRKFALAQGDAPFDEAAPEWLQKRHFACLMVNERIAALHASWDERKGVLLIHAPGGPPFAGDTATAEGRAAIATWLATFLGDEARGAPRFVVADGHSFSDHRNKVVSLINLASLAELERAMGRSLDPLRFRANVYFSGAPAWAEFGWLGRRIEVGAATLTVTKRIPRCAATEVNPVTARRDCDPVAGLRQAFGHIDLGVYARVEAGGRVAVGDAIMLRDDEE
ncbi:MOSC domain-containing protein [Elioraea sp.]|uniref:MOSC domain-containing protein n=1 Tax=Elioraea sp. TaxID=2185103 RepID=UPI00307FC8B1